MTRLEVRKKALAKEERIKKLLDKGMTQAEVAAKLGISKRSLESFLYLARRRSPVLSQRFVLQRRAQESKALKGKNICLAPTRRIKMAHLILRELLDILILSNFVSLSHAHGNSHTILINVGERLKYPDRRKSVETLVRKVRAAVLAADTTALIRRSFPRPELDAALQSWVFTFTKK